MQPSESVILVADDEPFLLKLVCLLLRENGYAAILTAANGQEALKLAEADSVPIHLLLSDVAMPRMNGPELARQMQRVHPQMRVLMMSAYYPDSLALEPDWHFIQKPFAPHSLLEKVHAVLHEPFCRSANY
jgi:DNA-binding NtrC family response regulator